MENETRKLEGNKLGADITNGKMVASKWTHPNEDRDRSTNTREQIAKMSGVGTGTVARYDAIMKSDKN